MVRNFFLIFSYLFFLCSLSFSQTDSSLKKIGDGVVNLEFNTIGVDIEFISCKENFISYKIEDKDNKISVFENKKKCQFFTIAPAKAKIFIYLPEDFLLDSCRLQTIHSKIKIENIKSIYFVFSASHSDIMVKRSVFKNILFAVTHSKIVFASKIISVADFCVNHSRGKISIPEEQTGCNLFITQTKNNKLLFNKKPYTDKTLSYNPKQAKKYITVSADFSNLAVNFVESFASPKENFNKYGISEFGPKPPPNLVDPVSNFVPKK